MLRPKEIFAAGFFLSIAAFLILIILSKETYLYEVFVHTGFLFAGLYLVWKGGIGETLRGIGIPGSLKFNILWTIAGAVLVFIAMLVLVFILSFFDINDNYKVYDIIKGVPAWLLVLAVLGAPISEELFFRAALVQRLGVFGPAAAIIGSAAIFGLFHFSYGSVMEVAGAALIGLVLAFVFQRSGSIIPPMILHLGYNLMSVVAVLYGGS